MLIPRDLNKCLVKQCILDLNTDLDGGINNPVLSRPGENQFWVRISSTR
jgi:hypothetical protein